MPATWLLALLAFAAPQQTATQHCTVRGVVLDGEQRPLGNVAMAVVEDGRDLAQALAAPAARSAADGSFRLELDVRTDTAAWLVIAAPRFATMMVRLAGDIDLGIIAMAPGGIGAGRVRDAQGAPVAGASVVISDLLDTRVFLASQRGGDGRARCRTTAVTDGSGIFRAPGMVLSAGVLSVGKDSFGDAVLQPVALGDPLEVTLMAAPPVPKVTTMRTIRVVAVTPMRRRAATFTVWVAWIRQEWALQRDLSDAALLAPFAGHPGEWTADAQGGVATVKGNAPGNVDAAVIFAMAEGCGIGRLEVLTDELGDEPVTIQLPYEAVVRGRVCDAAGKPIAGASVTATQDLSAQLRLLLESGRRSAGDFADGPMSTRTDGGGNYELRCLAPGSNAVLVHAPGRGAVPLSTVFLGAAAERVVDFTVPDLVTLQGRFDAELPAGTRSRVRWMSPLSPPESTNDSGGVLIGADRSFAMSLTPGQYELYVLPPVPPRGGCPLPVRSGQWQHAATAEGVMTFNAPAVASMKGRVDGPVPWSRLAVAAMTWDQTRRHYGFSVTGPIALVQRDRSYRLALPPVNCHLLLFDVFTGVPLEWHRAGPQLDSDTVDFAGNAESLELRLTPADPAARGALCMLSWLPDNQDWPAGVGSLPSRPGTPNGMLTDARAGDTVQFWVPARRGEVLISDQGRGLSLARIRLAETGTEPVAVPIPAPQRR